MIFIFVSSRVKPGMRDQLVEATLGDAPDSARQLDLLPEKFNREQADKL